MALQRPNCDYVRARLAKIRGDEEFNRVERAVNAAFQTWPMNTVYHEVLIKFALLNQLYHTSVFYPYVVTNRILALQIDDRLRRGDASLVEEIAAINTGKKRLKLLSFATKYCSWHQPDHFQIVDRNVRELLWAYKKTFGFAVFKWDALLSYPSFVDVVDQMRTFFGLGEFSRKELDKFMWDEGGRFLAGARDE